MLLNLLAHSALVKWNGGSMVKVGCDMRDTGLRFSYMMNSGPPALPCLNTQLGVEMSVNQMEKINYAKVGNRAEKKVVDSVSVGVGSLAQCSGKHEQGTPFLPHQFY